MWRATVPLEEQRGPGHKLRQTSRMWARSARSLINFKETASLVGIAGFVMYAVSAGRTIQSRTARVGTSGTRWTGGQSDSTHNNKTIMTCTVDTMIVWFTYTLKILIKMITPLFGDRWAELLVKHPDRRFVDYVVRGI